MKGKEFIKESSKNILSYIKNNYPEEYQKTLEKNSDYLEIYYGDFLNELNPSYKKEDLYLSEENLTNQDRDFNTFIIDKNDYCFVESTGRASELLEFLEVDESEDFFKSKSTLIFETKEDYENWCNINDLLKENYNLDQDYEEEHYDM